MPIVKYYVVAGRHDDASLAMLLTKSCEFFAEVLECPVDRVRAFAHEFRPQAACVGGRMVSDGGDEAPYFRFVLLQGRSDEQAQRLLTGFTDLIVECLGTDRSLIRGGTWSCEPTRWAIAGIPASVTRKAEIDARAAQKPS